MSLEVRQNRGTILISVRHVGNRMQGKATNDFEILRMDSVCREVLTFQVGPSCSVSVEEDLPSLIRCVSHDLCT